MTSPLIVDSSRFTTAITNILLIDSDLNQYQNIANSANQYTLSIVYSKFSNYTELLDILNNQHLINVNRIGIAFNNDLINSKYFMGSTLFFSADDIIENVAEENYSYGLEMMIKIIRDNQIINLDFLAPNTLLSENWKLYYKLLSEKTSVIIGIGVNGPSGPSGLQGPSGPAGLQGIAGPRGIQGPSGPGDTLDIQKTDVDSFYDLTFIEPYTVNPNRILLTAGLNTLQYNPYSNILGSDTTIFNGISNKVNITTNSDNTDHNLLFTVSGDNSKTILTNSNIKYNPSTSTLSLTSLKLDNSKIVLGTEAGMTNQGVNSVAIGNNAGKSTQSSNCVAIGYFAGNANQSSKSIAIGFQAGKTLQGTNCIAIGSDSGNSNQGNSSVAIGFQAGNINQHANSIILNATDLALNSTTTNQFVVKPLRNEETTSSLKNLNYNTSSGEITYSSIPSTQVQGYYYNASVASTTFDILSTYKNLTIEMVAGGGSGAYTTTFHGGSGGGGAGSYIKAYFPNNQTGTLTCIVGKGGAGVTTANTDGIDGSTTSVKFGDFTMTCLGGKGGIKGGEISGGVHGFGGDGGDTQLSTTTLTNPPVCIRVSGGDGTNANGGVSSVSSRSSGNGGASYFGSGGKGSVATGGTTGSGKAYGSGGGGSQTSGTGKGADGIIIITYTL
jgi:hypothetical protein